MARVFKGGGYLGAPRALAIQRDVILLPPAQEENTAPPDPLQRHQLTPKGPGPPLLLEGYRGSPVRN